MLARKISIGMILLLLVIDAFAVDRLVPSQYSTIQAGINAADNNDRIILADGNYSGSGNLNIDFGNKAITVQSQNGPGECIIDCQNAGDGFHFYSGEGEYSILSNITIKNADYSVHCINASNPKISGCVIKNSTVGIKSDSSLPAISDNSIHSNTIGIEYIGSYPLISNNNITNNSEANIKGSRANLKLGWSTDSHNGPYAIPSSWPYCYQAMDKYGYMLDNYGNNMDFLMVTGDFTHQAICGNLSICHGTDCDQPTEYNIRELLQVIGTRNIPRHIVMGNHDPMYANVVGSGCNGNDYPITYPEENGFSEKEAWMNIIMEDGPTGIFNIIFNGEQQGYYSFSEKGYHFVLLDFNYDWGYPSHEQDWLEQDLAAHSYEPTFVFTHYGPTNHPSDEPSGWPEIMQIMTDAGNVKAVFSGHMHPTPTYSLINGINYYKISAMVLDNTDSNMGGNLGNTTFAIIEAQNDTFNITGYGLQTNYSNWTTTSFQLPSLQDNHWIGGDNGDWSTAANWGKGSEPSLSDAAVIDNKTTAQISSGNETCKWLFVGHDNGGAISHTGGTITIDRDIFIGGMNGCDISKYTISDGRLDVDANIFVGRYGNGVLDINSSDANINTKNILLGVNSSIESVAGGKISIVADDDGSNINGRFAIDAGANSTQLAGFGNLTVECQYQDNEDVVVAIEAAGSDSENVTVNDFSTANFVFDKLTVGKDGASGTVALKLIDDSDNQGDGSGNEAIYVRTLEMKAGAAIANEYPYTEFKLYYLNGGAPKRLLAGDVDLDGDVDQNDIDICTEHQGTGSQWSQGDVDGDHVVNGDDIILIETAMKIARDPSPANGSTVTNNSVLQLEWAAGGGVVSHNVYLGLSYNAINAATEQSAEFKGNQTATVYRPVSPLKGRTYYWRIDEIDSQDNVTKGCVWTFTYDPVNLVYNETSEQYYGTITQAIDDANNGDYITISQCGYLENLDFKGKAITIRGIDPCDWDVVTRTVVHGTVTFNSEESNNSILSGLNIMSGIQCSSSSPTISKCIINGMTGVQLESSNATISECRIGGGGYSCYGISAMTGSPHIERNEIKECDSGIICSSSNIPLIRNNYITNCGIGMGFDFPTGQAQVTNNTIVGNDYGVYVLEDEETVLPLIENCIVWGSTEYDLCQLDENYDIVATTLNVSYSCIEDGAQGASNISENPQLINDYHLSLSSPCINAGNPQGYYNDQLDLDGKPRLIGSYIDIGADEVNVPVSDAHQWGFDERSGTIAKDSVGDANATFNGSDPCWVDGIIGGAIDCNGVSDYFTFMSETLNPGNDYNSMDTFTVAGWFMTSKTTGMQTIIGQWGNYKPSPYTPSMYFGWQILVENNKALARFGSASGSSDIIGTSNVTDGQWHHFVLVYPTQNANAVLYVDANSEGAPGHKPFTLSGPIAQRIGDGSYATGVNPIPKGGPFCGKIDDVMIFDYALTANEVLELYQSYQ